MGFEGLLGNERLKENLRASLEKGRISHFYLISGPAGSGKHTLARLLAAAILCREAEKPCLSCHTCRKVLEDLHPDVITVSDPEHKTVSVKLVREAREDMFVRPNEGERKIYLFPQELGLEGMNALLKVLEEPPSYGVFLLLSDNPEKLLPTVRSRCVELALTALPEALLREQLRRDFPQAEAGSLSAAIRRSGGFLGQARELLGREESHSPQTLAFVKAFGGKSALGLTEVLVPMEKWKRDLLSQELSLWLELLEGGLACRGGLEAADPLARQLSVGRSSRELMDAIRALQKVLESLQGNASPAAVCGYLAWALR